MRIWKQLFISLVVVIAGLVLWLKLVPGADALFAKAGVPQSLIGLVVSEKTDAAGGSAAGGAPGAGRRGGFGGAAVVVTAPVADAIANDRLAAIGNGAAIRSVTVTPDEAGKLAEIVVTAGAMVKAGDVLARLDNREQTIALEQAKLGYSSAMEKLERYESLKGNLSKVDLADARSSAQTARLALESAQLALEQRDIRAPINGVAGIVDVELGDNLTSTSAVVTIDDRSAILIEFWVPERFADTIKPGMPVSATAVARPGIEYDGTIAAVDSRIDEASRTIRAQARIPNDNDELRAGMSFKVTLKFEGETYAAVDPLSILWDSKGSYVWKVVDGKAVRAAVRIIQRNPESVLVTGEVETDDQIVVEGVQRVREGGTVRIQGDGPPAGTGGKRSQGEVSS